MWLILYYTHFYELKIIDKTKIQGIMCGHPSTPLKPRFIATLILMLSLAANRALCSIDLTLTLAFPISTQEQHSSIIESGKVTKYFNDKDYLNTMTCTNNEYRIIDFKPVGKDKYQEDQQQRPQTAYIRYQQERQEDNNQKGLELAQDFLPRQYHRHQSVDADQLQKIVMQFRTPDGTPEIDSFFVEITAKPHVIPLPSLESIDYDKKQIVVLNNCPRFPEFNITNYFNRVEVQLTAVAGGENSTYTFSFLLNCDKGGRHKKFEVGYLIISFINTAIIIGVALHSRIWSLRYNMYPIAIELKWHRFLIFMLVGIAIATGFYIMAADQFKNANIGAMYVGLIISLFFSFICWDEALFLSSKLRKSVWKFGQGKQAKSIRICDILSLVFALAMFGIGFVTDGWIYNDIMAICICVGSIKMFKFRSLKQGFLSLLIMVIFQIVVAIVLHFLLDRSYNDYATELASPLFLTVPDMIDSLFKKCSWLPIFDVIVPGVFLSFLRKYDENYNTGWGGVYTTFGNLAFIFGTLLWVLLEAIYPFSIPFSLITYPTLFVLVGLLSIKRNEFKTLWEGRFNGAMAGNDEYLSELLLDDDEDSTKARKSFGKLVGQEVLDAAKYGMDGLDDESSEGMRSKLKDRTLEEEEENSK